MKINDSEPFVEIQIDNLGKYLDVALLVDKAKFRRLIPQLRKEFNIKTSFPSVKPKIDFCDFDRKLKNDNVLKKKFDKEIENIRLQFNRPTHFTRVIYKSIVVGVINNNDYMSAYLEEHFVNPVNSWELLDDVKYAIIISPITKKSDVDRVFSDFQKRVKKNYSTKHDDPGYDVFFEPRIYTDSKEAIKESRMWYIKTERGIKPLELALSDKKSTRQEYKMMIDKSRKDRLMSDIESEAVERYLNRIDTSRKRIKAQLTRYRRLLERL